MSCGVLFLWIGETFFPNLVGNDVLFLEMVVVGFECPQATHSGRLILKIRKSNAMLQIINTENLAEGDLPAPNSSWSKIIEFASTFDISSECKDGCDISGFNDITEESPIPQIRAALYAEWRRYNHSTQQVPENVERKANEVVTILRGKLK